MTVYGNIDYGLSILSKSSLKVIQKESVFDLKDFFNILIKEGKLSIFEVKERFYEIGSPQGLEDFRAFIAKRG